MAAGHATSRYIRTSAQKAGLVLDQIRGRDVTHALATLRFSRKLIARDIEKVLPVAVATCATDGFSATSISVFARCCAHSWAQHERVRRHDGSGLRVVSGGALSRGSPERRASNKRPRRQGASRAQASSGERWDRRFTRPGPAGFQQDLYVPWYADGLLEALHEDRSSDDLRTRFAHAGVARMTSAGREQAEASTSTPHGPHHTRPERRRRPLRQGFRSPLAAKSSSTFSIQT